MENLAGISGPQVTHLEQKDPYILFSVSLFSFNGKNFFQLKMNKQMKNRMYGSFFSK